MKKMEALTILLLCVWTVGASDSSSLTEVTPEADRPSQREPLDSNPSLKCCHRAKGLDVDNAWIARIPMTLNLNKAVNMSTVKHVVTELDNNTREEGVVCYKLNFKLVQLNDSGLYQCRLTHKSLSSPVFTHGTYLQVYRPFRSTLGISEHSKNNLLVAEGVLLMLGVFLPGAMMICKSKKGNEMRKRKMRQEEENIYEGLNLEECSSAYDQVQRSLVQGPYQDVGNVMIEEGDIQLEKP
ncbi:hypothetical protein UPYG_G00152360 [Umbra pygmaea]|uniref:B-cell antigen receptor complex-associated protein alpha chain n=1 Tax=Umbra pygmaea TaxID=75934 RepID=A0ABD0XJX0_UMBPY